MYEIACEECGRVGFHPSRTAAEFQADDHGEATGHDCCVEPMEDD